ncbi:MAG: DUF3617 domain-containing protein [Parvibaculaceae bacterium]
MQRLVAAGVLGAVLLVGASPAPADELPPRGSYRVSYWLELPHVERWALRKETSICLSGDSEAAIFPVLSANTPFAGCGMAEWRREGDHIAYRVVCVGRDAARATATFTVKDNGFEGRIDMVMGAKNMTMTEVQVARRLGSCAQASRQDERTEDR